MKGTMLLSLTFNHLFILELYTCFEHLIIYFKDINQMLLCIVVVHFIICNPYEVLSTGKIKKQQARV
jgi:hypothetical protein